MRKPPTKTRKVILFCVVLLAIQRSGGTGIFYHCSFKFLLGKHVVLLKAKTATLTVLASRPMGR